MARLNLRKVGEGDGVAVYEYLVPLGSDEPMNKVIKDALSSVEGRILNLSASPERLTIRVEEEGTTDGYKRTQAAIRDKFELLKAQVGEESALKAVEFEFGDEAVKASLKGGTG